MLTRRKASDGAFLGRGARASRSQVTSSGLQQRRGGYLSQDRPRGLFRLGQPAVGGLVGKTERTTRSVGEREREKNSARAGGARSSLSPGWNVLPAASRPVGASEASLNSSLRLARTGRAAILHDARWGCFGGVAWKTSPFVTPWGGSQPKKGHPLTGGRGVFLVFRVGGSSDLPTSRWTRGFGPLPSFTMEGCVRL